MKNPHPFVSVIIVNYNGKHFLKNCLDSLAAMDYPKNKLEVIVVDNGSSDGSVVYMETDYPAVKVLRCDVNNYCRANNLGIKHAKGEFVVLANNDLVFDKKWLTELIPVFAEDGRIGAVTGKVLFPDGRLQGAGHEELPNFYWSDRGFQEEDKGLYDKLEEIKSISHCAAVYRKTCLDAIGPLDEDFNMFVEDVDMALRATRGGWRLMYAPGGRVYHKFHGTAKQEDVDFRCERNRLLLVAKHYPSKLPEALFGTGYFTALNHRSDLFKVLPEVLRKWITANDPQTVLPVVSDFFTELEKILNVEKNHLIAQWESCKAILLEKDRLAHQKDEQLAANAQELARRGEQLEVRGQQLSGLNVQLIEMERKIVELGQQIARKDEQLGVRDGQLSKLNEQFVAMEKKISDFDQRIGQKDEQLRAREQQLSELSERILKQDGEIKAKGGIVREQEEGLRVRDSKIRLFSEGMARLNKRLKVQEEKISALREEVGRKEERISAIHEILKKKTEKLDELYDSKTYRFIVKPIIWPFLSFLKLLPATVENIYQGIRRLMVIKKRKKTVSVAQFYAASAQAYPMKCNEYFIKLVNNDFSERTVYLIFDIWPFRCRRHPDRHFAYFDFKVRVEPKKACMVKITYDWERRVAISADEREIKTIDLWRGAMNDSELYILYANLKDEDSGLFKGLHIIQKKI